MPFEAGHFVARLGIDTSGYARGILNAQTTTAVFGQTFVNFVTNPLLGAIGLMKDLTGGLVRAGKDTLAWAESLKLLSDQTGVSTTTIQALREALSYAGDEGSKVDQILVFLSNRLGEIRSGLQPVPPQLEHMASALRSVGSTEDALRLILDEISRAPDAMGRMQIAADLLGKQAGGALVAALGSGSQSVDDAVTKFTKLGKVVSEETLDPMLKLATNVDELTFAFDGAKRAFITGLLAALGRESAVAEGSITSSMEAVINKARDAGGKIGEQLSSTIGKLDELVNKLLEAANAVESFGGSVGTYLGPSASSASLANDVLTGDPFKRRIVEIRQDNIRRRANR